MLMERLSSNGAWIRRAERCVAPRRRPDPGPAPARWAAFRQGFTLIEIMLVVTIIGLLAVIAVPLAARSVMRTRNTMFMNDLRMLTGAFSQYALESGEYPPDTPPRVLPPAIEPYLRGTDWSATTPIGGHWDWERAPERGQTVHGGYAVLSIILPNRTRAQMTEIDAEIDDGNLETGRFRGTPERYVYVVETQW